MSEAKTGEGIVKGGVPRPDVRADAMPSNSKFDQSREPIPKTVPPRGSKDARSFRPSTLAEINLMNRYEPLEVQCFGRTIPIGCGNSLEDLLLSSACIFALWSFILAFASLLLKSAIDTDLRHTALWIYFWAFIFAVLMLGAMIATGQVERRRADAAVAEKQKEEGEALLA